MTRHYDIDATREDRWLVKIIPLENNTLTSDGYGYTRVTHRHSGKITVHSGWRPAEGWLAWLHRQRARPVPRGVELMSLAETDALAAEYEAQFVRWCSGS